MKKRRVSLKRTQLATSSDDRNSSSSSSSSPNSSSSAVRTVRYGECQRNQAADVGGYAVDGCREFMPCGEEGTNEAMTCAACGCHRSFHRRELVETNVAC